MAAVNAQFVTPEKAIKEQKAIQKYHLFKNVEAEVNSHANLINETFHVSYSVSDL